MYVVGTAAAISSPPCSGLCPTALGEDFSALIRLEQGTVDFIFF